MCIRDRCNTIIIKVTPVCHLSSLGETGSRLSRLSTSSTVCKEPPLPTSGVARGLWRSLENDNLAFLSTIVLLKKLYFVCMAYGNLKLPVM